MPRNNNSTAKKKREKALLAQNQNSVRTNSFADLEQRTDEREQPKGGGNLFPPTHPAATAASPQPPVDLSLKDTSQPIAKLEDPSYDTKKETASTICTASEFEDYMLMLQRESLSIVRKWTWNEKEKKETSESDLFFYFPPKVIEEEHSSSQNMLDQKKMKSISGRTIFNSCR